MKRRNKNKSKSVLKLVPAGLLPLGLILSGCGQWEKDPVSQPQGLTLKELRVYAKDQSQKLPDKPRVITETIVVERPQVVIREESSIDEKFIVITPDSQMTFNEGQKGSFNVRARVLVPGVQVKLKAVGLPEGATFTPSQSEKDLYILTWTPALYILPPNAGLKIYTVKIIAEVTSGGDTKNASKLQGLVREKEIDLSLFRTQEAPSGLKVTNLNPELNEGEVSNFTVEVTVPGVDGSTAVKPRLVISFDGVGYTAGNKFLELDGSRHVIADQHHKEAEYLGDYKWKFYMNFDTKNISVQPQLAKDGTPLQGADGTRVRLSFKVFSPFGLSTPESLVQLKIHTLQKNTEGSQASNETTDKAAEQAEPPAKETVKEPAKEPIKEASNNSKSDLKKDAKKDAKKDDKKGGKKK